MDPAQPIKDSGQSARDFADVSEVGNIRPRGYRTHSTNKPARAKATATVTRSFRGELLPRQPSVAERQVTENCFQQLGQALDALIRRNFNEGAEIAYSMILKADTDAGFRLAFALIIGRCVPPDSIVKRVAEWLTDADSTKGHRGIETIRVISAQLFPNQKLGQKIKSYARQPEATPQFCAQFYDLVVRNLEDPALSGIGKAVLELDGMVKQKAKDSTDYQAKIEALMEIMGTKNPFYHKGWLKEIHEKTFDFLAPDEDSGQTALSPSDGSDLVSPPRKKAKHGPAPVESSVKKAGRKRSRTFEELSPDRQKAKDGWKRISKRRTRGDAAQGYD